MRAATHSGGNGVSAAGDTDKDYPALNVHILEPPDSFALELISSSQNNYRRQLTELEEQRVAHGDVAANVMASIAAQTQA